MDKSKILIIKKDQIWVIQNILGTKIESPVGTYAIITNKGIILENGCVLNDGSYISKDDDLPNVNDCNGHIRQFKCLFSDFDYYRLNDFKTKFCNVLKLKNRKLSWKFIKDKLHNSWQGKDLIINYGLKIHSIINVDVMAYGISLNNDKYDVIGNEGFISVVNKANFILEINKKIILI